MRLAVATHTADVYNLEVSDDIEVENFKAYCEVESGISLSSIELLYEGKPLSEPKKALKDYGIKDGDMLLMVVRNEAPAPAALDFGGVRVPAQSQPGYSDIRPVQAGPDGGERITIPGLPADAATLREMLLNSPHELSLLKERNPRLAEALLSGSIERFADVLRKQQQERERREQERMQMLMADPFDPDAQRRIAEEIRLENINQNMETAMEYAPESFGQVHMLYVDCRVNGQDVKAFVDSGAQMTIMSLECARRCHIERLIDNRWAGIAKGVGTQKIIGRVHMCPIQVGQDFLPCTFAILEDQSMDMLLGLDMLRRHQCSIDLKNNILTIGTTGTFTSFLSEGELPSIARLNHPTADDAGLLSSRSDQHSLITQTRDDADSAAASSSRRPAAAAALAGGSADAAAAVGAPQASSSRSSGAEFSESSIQTLMTNGFSRDQAILELRQSGGDPEKALMALLVKSLSSTAPAGRRQ